MTRPSVLACGLATLDVVQTVERLPGPDEKVVATGLLVAAGGPAANAAVTATALGVPTRLVSRVGTGAVGRVVADDLAAHGVELVDLAEPGASPAVSTVLVTAGTGQRAVVSVNATGAAAHAGTNAADTPSPDWAALITGADVLLVDGHHLDLAVPAALAARDAGVPVLLDGGSWKPGLDALLALVDLAALSADFAVPGSTDPVLAVAELGPTVVARSRGAEPIDVLDTHRHDVPVPTVEVVDTLGAGDVLHGALAAWLAVRGPDVPAGGLAWAATVASASCTAHGARGWLDGPARLGLAAELHG